ncbi:hypothetical protein NEOCIP111885_04230 [Pseudoneobacillus rhizosphaerae]|uniref:Uncharacterized protein n=1 Tax=Pseudoneobacillus rhizosphaerae TaxID=2880968 RepID=A0A9C7LBS1_9BACI|nr:hypothetical protein NEOCIP111885_04230 [Pseudoneobacillus rhizosphaerae]
MPYTQGEVKVKSWGIGGSPSIRAVIVIVILPGPVGVMFVLKNPLDPVKPARGETVADPLVMVVDMLVEVVHSYRSHLF